MIGLYCPDVPPVAGGVADHTLALARALTVLGTGVAVFAERGEPAAFGSIPCTVGLKPRDVGEAARAAGVRALLVQYVPFLFARRGVSPALVSAASGWRRSGLRYAMFVHEPYVPLTRLPWIITGIPQRLQLALLLRGATHAYTAVPAFAQMCRRWAGRRTDVRLAPVGATIPPSSLSREAARARLDLAPGQVAIGVFSPGASGFARSWITVAAARVAERPSAVWVWFGNGSEQQGHMGTAARVQAKTIVVGSGDAAAMADTMRAMDLAAAPFLDGLTLRRTSAMLALASGVPLVSSTGPLWDTSLKDLAACEPNQAAFAGRIAKLVDDPAERAQWSARTAAYHERASVEALAAMLARDLGAVPAGVA